MIADNHDYPREPYWYVVYSDCILSYRFRWQARLRHWWNRGLGVFSHEVLYPEFAALYERLASRAR